MSTKLVSVVSLQLREKSFLKRQRIACGCLGLAFASLTRLSDAHAVPGGLVQAASALSVAGTRERFWAFFLSLVVGGVSHGGG